ncbi:RagB/SusD family nutrient uptake outer membrane protein, partial [Myroides odoratimimus]
MRAEALLARAYNHFMLVNLWAKHYNPATAESDLGIPYVT